VNKLLLDDYADLPDYMTTEELEKHFTELIDFAEKVSRVNDEKVSQALYELSDRLVKTEDSNGNWFKYDYDKTNKTSKKENYIAGKSYSTSFEFDKDGKTENVSLPSGKTFFYIYDSIGRTKFRTLNLNSAYTYDTEYKYKDGYAGSTTSLVSSIKNGTSEIKYTYDDLGRIETIDNGKLIKYYYDSLGQVVREDNGEINKTIACLYL